MRTNQKGFGTLALIFIVAALVIIGGTAWYVLQINDTTDGQNQQTVKSDEELISDDVKRRNDDNPNMATATITVTDTQDSFARGVVFNAEGMSMFSFVSKKENGTWIQIIATQEGISKAEGDEWGLPTDWYDYQNLGH